MYNMEIRFRNQVECESGKRYNRIGYNRVRYNIEVESVITEKGITESCITWKLDSGIRYNM